MTQAARKLLHKALFWSHYKMASLRVSSPPLVINVEPTNHCNLRCPFCPVSQHAHDPAVARGFLSIDLARRLARELSSWQPMVAMNLGGESALHRDLAEVVRLFADAGCYVFLDTNAVVLTPEKTDALIDSGLAEIVFCIDGEGDPESYRRMRQRGDLKKAVANARYFICKARASSRRVRPIKTVVKNIRYFDPSSSFDVPDRVVALFEGAEPDVFRASWADYWPGDHAEKLTETYAVEPFLKGRYQACTNLWKKMAISWDGKVFACCLDLNRTTEIGDLNLASVMEVWNGAPMQQMRLMHREGRQGDSPLCRGCTMIQRPPTSFLAGILNLRGERFTPFADRRGHRAEAE